MGASTTMTPGVLFYTTALSTGTVEIYAGPSTSVRAIVTAVYVTNRTTSNATATITHRLSTANIDVDLMGATIVEASKSVIFGPIVMSSTSSQQSIRGNAGTAGAFQVVAYGYTEVI